MRMQDSGEVLILALLLLVHSYWCSYAGLRAQTGTKNDKEQTAAKIGPRKVPMDYGVELRVYRDKKKKNKRVAKKLLSVKLSR